ncbi:MAG TPA: DUF5691 domain-containing protein [Acidimicrobiales bacterium]|nr:DUF5691 domain-containing protein [Acidimicrobiales bacterium]
MTWDWDELVAGALVGTARRPPAVGTAVPATALGGALARIDPGDPEGAVLAAGVVVGLYRQAGVRPAVDEGPLPPTSRPEQRARCSPAAAARLDAMVTGRFRPVLPEWLGLAAAAGVLVLPDRLPSLLDVATAHRDLRAATVEVIGERGRWLAGLRPAWAWAAGAGDADADKDAATWVAGTSAARRLLLRRLRATSPGAARAVLESTWATETPDDRAAFVALLATGLSADDEPILEAALDDRRKEVRLAAAELLWRLPGSRLGRRMADRARPLVRIAGTPAQRIEAALPDEVDAAAARDGVVAKPPAGVGARAWWLHQLVAATPLSTWPDALGHPPGRMVELAAGSETGRLVRRAWASAAVHQGDPAWAEALVDAEWVAEPALLEALPNDVAVRVAIDRVVGHGLAPAVLDLLDHCPPPWGPGLSAVVVEQVGAAVARPGRPGADAVALRGRLGELALRLDPSVTPAAVAVAADAGGWWSDVVGWFADLLTFRVEMREELPS